LEVEERTVCRRERALLLIAAAFLLVGVLTLAISNIQHPTSNFQLPIILAFAFITWALSFSAAHLFLCRLLPERDPLLLPVAALLTGWGLLLVARLAPNFLLRQALWLLVSTAVLLAVARAGRDLRWLRRFRYTWLFGGLALLAATFVLGVNPSGYGPRLWLGAAGIYFQPSEILKLLLAVYLASYLAERRELIVTGGHRIGRWRLPPLAYVGPLLMMFGLAVVLLAWQQDLGAAILFFFTFLAMLYLATGQWGYFAAGLLLFLAAGVAAYTASSRVALRVDTWLNPWPEAADRAFQIVQSLLAFGAGGIFGQGVGLGNPTYIPAVHTDFVFAAIGEEFGLLGTLGVIALYATLMLRGLRVAARARQSFERFLAAGIAAGIAIQAWVIMAGNIKIIPITGVTLPFVSYGGSSLLTSFIALALLLRVSNQPTDQQTNQQTNQLTNKPTNQPTNKPLTRIACTLSLALTLLAATCGYWGVARAAALRARDDNPRRVLYEQRIVRGRILDRGGVVLADVEVAESGAVTRRYPVPQVAPVVGYASLRYGTGGIEAAFDEILRGEAGHSAWQVAWDELLHHPPQGHDVQLTLDATLQEQAQDALAGRSGAIVLLDATTGEILALASSPIFDPARLDETWEELRQDPAAPLLNRATHGLYQPGAALQTVILAEALLDGSAALDETIPTPDAVLPVNGARLACSIPIAGPATLAQAYAAACPTPFADLGERLGAAGLEEAIQRWALTVPPALEIPTESADWSADRLTTTAALRDEAVGQGQLTVTPLHMALVAATLANHGALPAPRLVLQLQTAQGGWRALEAPDTVQAAIPPEAARALLATWRPFGAAALGHLSSAVAGEDQPLAWFLGVAPAGAPRYAVAVLLEHSANFGQAAEVGSALLETAQLRSY
jgi:peptidoglycan glycosyltransferase